MKITSIKETCIYVGNLDNTVRFYHEKLKLPIISIVEGRHAFFRAGSSVLLCFIAEKTMQETLLPPHGAIGKIHFAFEVEKEVYVYALKLISEQQIDILHEHLWPNGVRSFYFHDPDLNVVEIMEPGLWEKNA